MQNKQKQKAEIKAYEAQQQAFEAERKKSEEAVCLHISRAAPIGHDTL
jgi:hypothetical protein